MNTKMNNVSNNQILISIILIIYPSLAFTSSKSTLWLTWITVTSGSVWPKWRCSLYPHSFIVSMTMFCIQLVCIIIAVNSKTLTILVNVIWIIVHTSTLYFTCTLSVYKCCYENCYQYNYILCKLLCKPSRCFQFLSLIRYCLCNHWRI